MTPLQWAVLSAYARALPEDSETRRALDAATAQGAPGPSGQRVALTLARHAGMIDGQRITEFGRDAARRFLARLPSKGQP
ncbi:hypothetical protein HNQ07_000430 [Deinococcus metalli]|uniref:Uncharacterized protein n=1 Tax=Deinococcus metalli TaxID=1141878 RepID=A0A7W8KDE1_9DEIO|nr:hypothetical protein [Deinococcus metalli]MBB5374986.1 hypothetical protein [Deinococcus metalli]GHF32278.1 hypothetical protein GCM10017781_06130 [Deinococcus metalli]